MFIWRISPLLQNLLQPTLLWLIIMVDQSAKQKDWFAIFKVTVKAHVIRYDCFYHSYWSNCWFFLIFFFGGWGGVRVQPYLIGWCIITSWGALLACIRSGLFCSRSRSQWRFKTSFTPTILCFLYHRSLGNQFSCVDVLLPITKPSTTRWAHTDSDVVCDLQNH